MASGTTTALSTWLTTQFSGVTILEDNSPNEIYFSINHISSFQPSHGELIYYLLDKDLWILSKGKNTAIKEYKIGNDVPIW